MENFGESATGSTDIEVSDICAASILEGPDDVRSYLIRDYYVRVKARIVNVWRAVNGQGLTKDRPFDFCRRGSSGGGNCIPVKRFMCQLRAEDPNDDFVLSDEKVKKDSLVDRVVNFVSDGFASLPYD